MNSEGLVTGHLDTGFLGFPSSLTKCCDGFQIQSSYRPLLMQSSPVKLIRIESLAAEATKNICTSFIKNLVSFSQYVISTYVRTGVSVLRSFTKHPTQPRLASSSSS
jgi:hypothetical protein